MTVDWAALAADVSYEPAARAEFAELEQEDQRQADRLAHHIRIAEEAVMRDLTERFGEDVPAHKLDDVTELGAAFGAQAFERETYDVSQATVLPPLAPATAADLRGLPLRYVERTDGPPAVELALAGLHVAPDDRVEVAVRLRAEDVAARHASEHADGWHFLCVECERRSVVGDVDPSGLALLSTRVHDRLRRYLAGNPGRALPPAALPREDDDVHEWLTAAELLARPAGGYLVEGVIPHAGVGYLVAGFGQGKTFLALDLALTVATELETWHGRELDHANATGRAVFVMSEGSAAAGQRVAAWLEHHELSAEDVADRLVVRPAAVNLFAGGPAYDELLSLVRETRPELVVVDTLQTCSVGADQNSAADVGVIGERLRALQRASGGSVLVLAHAGKNGRGARGSSAIEADADYVLGVEEWTTTGVRVAVTKDKDGPAHAFALGVAAVGDSLTITDENAAGVVTWSSSSAEQRVLGALRLLAPSGPATVAQLQAVVDDDSRPALHRGTLYRAVNGLVDTGRVELVKASGTTRRYRVAEESS